MTRHAMLLLALGLLGACETAKGVGQDVENLGQNIQTEVEEADEAT